MTPSITKGHIFNTPYSPTPFRTHCHSPFYTIHLFLGIVIIVIYFVIFIYTTRGGEGDHGGQEARFRRKFVPVENFNIFCDKLRRFLDVFD